MMHNLKFLPLVALLPSLTLPLFAQDPDIDTITIEEGPVIEELQLIDGQVFTFVEQMPEFPGGDARLMSFLKENIVYPAEARKNKISGTVYIIFTVNAEGNVINQKIARGTNPLLDAEALRVIALMPKWKPGKQSGKPVAVQYTMPVKFLL